MRTRPNTTKDTQNILIKKEFERKTKDTKTWTPTTEEEEDSQEAAEEEAEVLVEDEADMEEERKLSQEPRERIEILASSIPIKEHRDHLCNYKGCDYTTHPEDLQGGTRCSQVPRRHASCEPCSCRTNKNNLCRN
jgi:hypothetical protein